MKTLISIVAMRKRSQIYMADGGLDKIQMTYNNL